jgi:hypothetical protein
MVQITHEFPAPEPSATLRRKRGNESHPVRQHTPCDLHRLPVQCRPVVPVTHIGLRRGLYTITGPDARSVATTSEG